MSHYGLLWATVGHYGQAWAALGRTWLPWAFSSPRRPPQRSPTMSCKPPPCTNLGCHRMRWVASGYHGLPCETLRYFGLP